MTTKITINGKTFLSVEGNFVVSNGNVFIDGKSVEIDGVDQRVINIEINGNIQKMKVDACSKVSVQGSVGNLSTISGNVDCKDIGGNVSSISGDVRCENIGGSVSTVSGDIRHGKKG